MNVDQLLEREEAASASLRSLYVPEWELTVYARQRFTLEMLKPVRKGIEESDPAALAGVLARYSFKEDGSRLFRPEHRLRILKFFDSATVARVAAWIINGDDPEDDETDPLEAAAETPNDGSYSGSVTDGAEHQRRSNGS